MGFQEDWNNSLVTLLDHRATRPPNFKYDPGLHSKLDIVMSDMSELYVPKFFSPKLDKGNAVIKVESEMEKSGVMFPRNSARRESYVEQSANRGSLQIRGD